MIDAHFLILAVDDETVALNIINDIVSEICPVICCSDPFEVQSLALAKLPELILLDFEMTGKNGIQVCNELKADPITKDIPVIFVTSHESKSSEIAALEAGAIDFIHKPIDRHTCQIRIRNHLSLLKTKQALVKSQQTLVQQKQKLNITLNSIGDAVISTDAEGLVTFMNPVAENMTGWHQKDALGQPIEKIMVLRHADTQKPMDNPVFNAMREKRRVAMALNAQLQSKDGNVFRIEDSASPIILNNALIGAVVVFHDVSEAIAMAVKMNHIANHDPLTDLPNRILLHDRIGQGIYTTAQNNQIMALMLVDIDHFLYVNDSAGHIVGDLIIKKIADRLKTFAASPATVSRIGGDEFVLVLPNLCELTQAEQVANQIATSFQTPFVIYEQEYKLTVSIGISLYPDDANDEETLMRHADVAMFRAKEQGRNQHCYFSKELERKLVDRHSVESVLRNALSHQSLELYFQPQINLKTGEQVGAEALVRLKHGENFISPLSFISLAEENGMIHELGRQVLKQSCQMIKYLEDKGTPLKISVNIAARQFNQADFYTETLKIIKDSQITACYLELELTESALMHDFEETRKLLQKFRELGISIAIDDFGTGYSSLSYLKFFNVNILKIDQSFVFDMLDDQQSLNIVKAIISMANAMDLEIVAEGIESQKHAEKLIDLGCSIGQGYHYAKPLPIEQFIKQVPQH
ncbi:EAL domain-containing protein [Gayadomonas joobiniege]|uniref:EAL domain-containing protein n=1 Tax=Gayadomonas joobiniege TaxID=1234606 RepID=UPI00035F1742|nr:EAL domain-containing protein [Gayadomonas joobiniege]